MNRIYYAIILLLCFFTTNLIAQDFRFQIDQWDQGKTNILTENGDIIGYAKRDLWDESTINIHDVDGNIINKIQADVWDRDKINTFDSNGNLKRSEKQDLWNNDRTNIYDNNGNLIGYKEPDLWDSEKINVYDNNNTKVGYYSKNQWSGETEYHKIQSPSSSGLKIYKPESYQGPNVEFTPSLEVKRLDLSGLKQLANAELAARDRKIEGYLSDMKYWDDKIDRARSEQEKQLAIQGYEAWKAKTIQEIEAFLPPDTPSEKPPARIDSPTTIYINGKTKVVNFPKVDEYGNKSIQVTKVELQKHETIIHIRYVNDGKGWVNINGTACIYDRDKMSQLNENNPIRVYRLLKILKDSNGIPLAPYKKRLYDEHTVLEFSLVFPKINWKTTKTLDLFECESESCFNVFGIHLEK